MKIFQRILSVALGAFLMTLPVNASGQSSLLETERDISTGSLEDELQSPPVAPKLKSYISSYMQEMARNLYRDGYDVETMRGGEVVIVVLPSDNLFFPNEDKLLPAASTLLDRFRHFMTTPDKFKIVIAAHSDDTGSEEYCYDLTESRINSILDFFEERKVNIGSVTGFPKGFSDPVADNDTRMNRAKNRRIEIYILPDIRLLEEAKSKK